MEKIVAAIAHLLAHTPPLANPSYRSRTAYLDRYDSKKEKAPPPADDAPIEDLIRYWKGRKTGGALPSKEVFRRLREIPEIKSLSEYQDLDLMITHSWVRDIFAGRDDLDRDVMINNEYVRSRLARSARTAAQGAGPEAITNLAILARLDWEAARPIIENLAASEDVSLRQTALDLFYKHARENNDAARAESYRNRLKAIVADQRVDGMIRGYAVASLMEGEWNGQEEWFVSLFSDPALNGKKREEPIPSPSIFSGVLEKDPDKVVPIIVELAGRNDRAIQDTAVNALTSFIQLSLNYPFRYDRNKKHYEGVARALLPRLDDPNLTSNLHPEYGRYFVEIFSMAHLPESVPGLIRMLDDGQAASVGSGVRLEIAKALIKYRDPRAVPALRRALKMEKYGTTRDLIITALALSGGFSDDEMAKAIEVYLRMMATPKSIERHEDGRENVPLDFIIGEALYKSYIPSENTGAIAKIIQPTEGLAIELFDRIEALRYSQPYVAAHLFNYIRGMPTRISQVKLIERIANGSADIEDLSLALWARHVFQMGAGAELNQLLKRGGHAGGTAAALLGDREGVNDILSGTDTKARIALLACARYLREKLPLDPVAKLLNGADVKLASAAESYLEVENSSAARKLILARHPGEAFILGSVPGAKLGRNEAEGRLRQGGPSSNPCCSSWSPLLYGAEERLRKEVLSRNGPDEIYAIGADSMEDFKLVIRVRAGKAEMTINHYYNNAPRRVRVLTESEFQELKEFTSRPEVEDLGPESWETHDEGGAKSSHEYLRLTRDGGKRVILDNFHPALGNPTLHEQLSGLFYRLSASGEYKTQYAVEDKIPGLEAIPLDIKKHAVSVCGDGREIRALIGDRDLHRAMIGSPANLNDPERLGEWWALSSGRLTRPVDEPSSCRILAFTKAWLKTPLPEVRGGKFPEHLPRPSRSGEFIVYDEPLGKEHGVWKVEPHSEPVKILNGPFFSPVITPDGKWLIAVKDKQAASQIIRYDTKTRREHPINLPTTAEYYPVAFVADRGKVLITVSRKTPAFYPSSNYIAPSSDGYLLDPETGDLQPVKGDFQLLVSRRMKDLQPAGKPHEFWAAIQDASKRATVIGRYNTESFVFKPVMELPGFFLDTSDIWIDAQDNKVWFTHEGSLLRAPLPNEK